MERVERVGGLQALTRTKAAHWSDAFAEFDHDSVDPQLVYQSQSLHLGFSELISMGISQRVEKDDPSVNGNTLICTGNLNALVFFVLSNKIHFCINTDPSLDQRLIWNLFIDAVNKTDSPENAVEHFIEAFKHAKFNDKEFHVNEGALALKAFLLSRKSPFFLGAGYAKIKDAVSSRNIVLLCVNYTDHKGLEKFAHIARHTKIKARIVYAPTALTPFLKPSIRLPDFLLAMNLLASPDKGKNVLYIASSSVDSECTCVKKTLGLTTTNHIEHPPEIKCDNEIIHFNLLLDRIQFDCLLFLFGKFDKQVYMEEPHLTDRIITPSLARMSLELVRKNLYFIHDDLKSYAKRNRASSLSEKTALLPDKNAQAFEDAQDLFNKFYDLAIGELILPRINSGVFQKGLHHYFPDIALKYTPTCSQKANMVPEALFIFEEVFNIVRVAVNNILKAQR